MEARVGSRVVAQLWPPAVDDGGESPERAGYHC